MALLYFLIPTTMTSAPSQPEVSLLIERTLAAVYNCESDDAVTRRMVHALCQRARTALQNCALTPQMRALLTVDQTTFAAAVRTVVRDDGHMLRYMLPDQVVWHCMHTAAAALVRTLGAAGDCPESLPS